MTEGLAAASRHTHQPPKPICWPPRSASRIRKYLGKRIVARGGQGSPQRIGKTSRFGTTEPWENAMAQEPARPQKRLINLCHWAIDRADNLKSEKIAEQPVGEVQDRTKLIPVIIAPREERGFRVLQKDDKLPV